MGENADPGGERGIRRGLPLLFAVVGGVGVGNLYWAQPLLGDIGGDLGVTPATAGLLITVSQLGYAAGVFLLVPLGDVVDRKRMLPLMLVLCAVALVGCAIAPTFIFLLVALAAVGFANVAGQLLVGLAGDLASDEQRARVIATIASGLLMGILLSRTVSGLIAFLFDWRIVFGSAAVVLVGFALVVARAVPHREPPASMRYGQLLWWVVEAVRRRRSVQVLAFVGASLMCVFSAFWTGLTLLLSESPHLFTVSEIGLISLLGIVGVIGNQFVGRLHNQGKASAAIGVGLGITLCSLVLSGLGYGSVPLICISVALFSLGVQPALVLLQTVMVSMDPFARSRLNTAHIVCNFIGSAAGASLAAGLWRLGGWWAIVVGCVVVVAVALVVWGMNRGRAVKHP